MRPRTLVARIEARETLPREDAPGPLARRNIPANVAVPVLPLLNDAKSVAEKVQIGRVAWKSRVNDVDGIGMDIVLQTRSRFLTGAVAQCQKCQERCSCAAHGVGSLNDRSSMFGLAPTLTQRKRGWRGYAHQAGPAAVHSLRAGHASLPRQRESPLDY